MKILKWIIFIIVTVSIITIIILWIKDDKKIAKIDYSVDHIEKLDLIRKDIKERIIESSDGEFCLDEYNRIASKIDLFFNEQGKENPSDYKSAMNELNGAYAKKFVQQSQYVFNHRSWLSKDIKFIRNEYFRMNQIFPNNSSLIEIRNILDEYDILNAYYNRVEKQVVQLPKCINNSKYIFITDNWNISNTKRLISEIKIEKGLICNSPIYRNTRADKVKKHLYEGNMDFIEKKVEQAEKFKYESVSEWSKMYHVLTTDLDLLKNNIMEYGLYRSDISSFVFNIDDRLDKLRPPLRDEEIFSSISNISNLTKYSNRYTSRDQLRILNNLRQLIRENNINEKNYKKIYKESENLSHLYSNLEKLINPYKKISDIEILNNIKNIRSLRLYTNNFISKSQKDYLNKIKQLINDNNITDFYYIRAHEKSKSLANLFYNIVYTIDN